VGDNLRFVRDSFDSVSKIIAAYTALAASIPEPIAASELARAAETVRTESDIDYLLGEIPTALDQSLDGVKRVADIVRAMKEFSHPAGKEKTSVDINHAIETTLTVARNEWKYVAEVVTDMAPSLPLVSGFPDEINQVILNLLVNAAQAIADVVKTTGGKGTIKISTQVENAQVVIRVADTGPGIPEEIRHRIFELFFTTKEVGKGTGQGLALARSVVVNKHGGELSFESVVGKGTTFIVRLPVTSENAGSIAPGAPVLSDLPDSLLQKPLNKA
jgi:signal transduction histidine kinase